MSASPNDNSAFQLAGFVIHEAECVDETIIPETEERLHDAVNISLEEVRAQNGSRVRKRCQRGRNIQVPECSLGWPALKSKFAILPWIKSVEMSAPKAHSARNVHFRAPRRGRVAPGRYESLLNIYNVKKHREIL